MRRTNSTYECDLLYMEIQNDFSALVDRIKSGEETPS